MQKSIGRIAAGCVALAANSWAALAHHPGSIGNSFGAGPITTIAATTLDPGQSVAGITVDYTSLNPVSASKLIAAAAAGVDGVHGLRTLQSLALSYAHGVTADLTLGLRLPYVKRTGISAAEADGTGTIGVLDHGGASGIGDLTMLGQYRFLNDRGSRFEAALLLGVTAPTGETNRRSRQDELLDAEFQPGSGAWNGLAGIALTKRMGSWSFDTNVLFVRSSEATQHTNLGDQFLYNAAISYRFSGLGGASGGPMYHGGAPHRHDTPVAGPSLDLVIELNGEWHGKQRKLGVDDDNSGGTTIYLSPGLRVSNDAWSGFLSAGIPVVKDYAGTQPEPDWRMRSGIAVGF